MLDVMISVFKNAQSTDPKHVPLPLFLSSQKHKDTILALRQEEDKKVRDEMKRNLPAATISGTFRRRSADACEHYNGMVCLDFDAKDNPGLSTAEMKGKLAAFEEVAYAAVSVGGQGVFCIVPTNNTEPRKHAQVVDLLGTVMAQYGLHYDRACKDITRLRFVSFDDSPHVNMSARPFDAQKLLEIIEAKDDVRPQRPLVIRQAPTYQTDDRTRNRVEEFITALENSARDITDHYDDWIRIGLALANEFGSEGENFFHRISQFHPKYDQAATAKKYADFVKNGRRLKIGTFFKILETHGIIL